MFEFGSKSAMRIRAEGLCRLTECYPEMHFCGAGSEMTVYYKKNLNSLLNSNLITAAAIIEKLVIVQLLKIVKSLKMSGSARMPT